MLARRLGGTVLAGVARALLASCEVVIDEDLALDRSTNVPYVFCFWHGQQLALHAYERRRPTVALVSLSRDGEVQRAALEHLGFVVERGSSSRAGASGLKAIAKRLRSGHDAAFAVDGPRGPRGQVRAEGGRAGALVAAKLARGLLVPMASACSRAWVLERAWDRFEIPKPGGRVVIALGAPLSPQASPEDLGAAIDAARARALQLI